MTVFLTGRDLDRAAVARVARSFEDVVLAPAARKRLVRVRTHIDTHWMRDDAPLIYGFNTGVGMFKDQRVRVADMADYQTRLIKSHATGVGEPLAEDVVRATMVLRANAFAAGYSGPGVVVVDRLLAFLNRGLHPVIPSKGSVGASGDLAPLAYLAAALGGFAEAEIVRRGRRENAPAALAAAGLPVEFEFHAKDASALLNGSTVSLAISTLAVTDARRIVRTADIALAMTLEAIRGELDAFHSSVHQARPHPGQLRSASNVLRVTDGTRRCSPQARQVIFPAEQRQAGVPPAPRIQDAYSVRCAPQVHGPVSDALDYVDQVLGVEINSATDNPLIFPDGEEFVVLSGGNFHGQYLAQAMDLVAIALTDLGSISERRLARLIDPGMSHGLPRNLASGTAGVNTGYASMQCSMSALVMENRTLSAPGSVDSVPGKGNAEDHVSNSTWCARKARTVVDNVEQILACELLMAAQALSLVADSAREHPVGRGTQAALDSVRTAVPPALDGDRWFHDDMAAVLDLVHSGTLVAAVEAAVGPLDTN